MREHRFPLAKGRTEIRGGRTVQVFGRRKLGEYSVVGDFVGSAASFLSLRDSSYWWREFRAGEVLVTLRKSLSQEREVSA